MNQPVALARSARYWGTLAAISLTAAAIISLLYAGPDHPAAFWRALSRSLVYAATMSVLGGIAAPAVLGRLAPERRVRRWLALIGATIALAVAGTALAGVIIVALGLEPPAGFVARFRGDLRIVVLTSVAITAAVCVYEGLRARLEAAVAELHARELEQERTRKLAAEARLASLESRLHPHFFFNALNAVAALIHEDPERAERTVERLAALLRFSLDAAQRGAVPLADELKIVGDYLEIERARLGDRLVYEIAASPDVRDCAVPPLSIQTLVENSVKHAIAPRRGGGSVRIATRAAAEHLVVGVWDDGPGFALDDGAPGHGLDNLRGRLAARFGEAARLRVERTDGGTLVTLSLPLSLPLSRAAHAVAV
jgi:hypothetical protein